RRVLGISRWSTLLVLIACMGMAWALQDRNIALLVWIGSGGMMAAFAGPLVMGALWRGVTKTGAYAGLVLGMGTFITLHSGILAGVVDASSTYPLSGTLRWLVAEAPNPYSCAAIGELVSVGATWAVSKLTQPLDERHVASLFDTEAA
ncbi:MAG: sodium:pantothenate symporter, partial [Acidobacteriota bacterium]